MSNKSREKHRRMLIEIRDTLNGGNNWIMKKPNDNTENDDFNTYLYLLKNGYLIPAQRPAVDNMQIYYASVRGIANYITDKGKELIEYHELEKDQYKAETKNPEVLKIEILQKVESGLDNIRDIIKSYDEIEFDMIQKEPSPVKCDLGRDIIDITCEMINDDLIKGRIIKNPPFNWFKGQINNTTDILDIEITRKGEQYIKDHSGFKKIWNIIKDKGSSLLHISVEEILRLVIVSVVAFVIGKISC